VLDSGLGSSLSWLAIMARVVQMVQRLKNQEMNEASLVSSRFLNDCDSNDSDWRKPGVLGLHSHHRPLC